MKFTIALGFALVSAGTFSIKAYLKIKKCLFSKLYCFTVKPIVGIS